MLTDELKYKIWTQMLVCSELDCPMNRSPFVIEGHGKCICYPCIKKPSVRETKKRIKALHEA